MTTDPPRASASSRRRYWKTPLLFSIGFGVLWLLIARLLFLSPLSLLGIQHTCWTIFLSCYSHCSCPF